MPLDAQINHQSKTYAKVSVSIATRKPDLR